jgi:hypothetical protein
MEENDGLNWIILPVATNSSIVRLRNRLGNENIITKSLVKIKLYKKRVAGLLNILLEESAPEKYINIFTSKNSVLYLSHYLDNEVMPLFRKTICIGSATAETFKETFKDKISDLQVYVPEKNNSSGIIDILMKIEGIPIYWASKYSSWKLAKYVIEKGGIFNVIYKPYLDRKLAGEVTEYLKKYDRGYIIFLSKISLDFEEYLYDLKETELIGIFLSQRIYKSSSKGLFSKSYVYDSDDMEGFYSFLKGVINEE